METKDPDVYDILKPLLMPKRKKKLKESRIKNTDTEQIAVKQEKAIELTSTS